MLTILIELSENSDRLFNIIRQYWCILFDTAHIKRTGRRFTIFSEFTESHLLAASAEQRYIQQTTTNIFIYLVLETKVVTIDLMLKLLMDYLASRVCQAGYQTAQLVLQLMLESYFYNYHTARLHISNVITKQDKENCIVCGSGAIGGTLNDHSYVTITTNSSSLSASWCSQHEQNHAHRSNSLSHNYISYNHHHPNNQRTNQNNQQQTPAFQVDNTSVAESYFIEKFYGIPIHTEAIKILIRIYLGKIKANSQSDTLFKSTQSTKDQSLILIKRAKYLKFMRQNLTLIVQQHVWYARNISNGNNDRNRDSFISVGEDTPKQKQQYLRNFNEPLDKRPVLHLESRPKYLNSMEPFDSTQFLYAKQKLSDQKSVDPYELIGDWSDIQLTVLKLQVIFYNLLAFVFFPYVAQFIPNPIQSHRPISNA